jgi:predicted RNA-binding protein with RPS1 domain
MKFKVARHRPTLAVLVTMGYCLLQLQLQLHLVHAWTAQMPLSGNRFANRNSGTAGSHVDQQLHRLGLEQRQRQQQRSLDSSVCFMVTNDDEVSTTSATTTTMKVPRPRPCYYQIQKGEGQRLLRRQLQDLVPGQALQAFQVVSEKLEDCKTGPKIFLDVGVGRYRVNNKRGNQGVNVISNVKVPGETSKTDAVTVWSIVTAMVRLGGPNMKPSVARKKATKIRQKCEFVPEKSSGSSSGQSDSNGGESAKSKGKSDSGLTVYVTRIDTASVQLEVSVDPEDGIAAAKAARKKGSTSASLSSPTPSAHVSSLRTGQELQGTIERVEDYGCLVKFQGVKRHGLLRIQSVADLYGTYIGKKGGLIEAGLERGAAIKVQVANVTGKRLLLDFTNATKEQALEEQKEQAEVKAEEVEEKAEKLRQRREQFNKSPEQQKLDAQNAKEAAIAAATTSATELSPEEEAAWAAYASADSSVEVEEDSDKDDDDDEDDDYDDDGYDEDRDIEDALGLGSY